MTESTRNHVTHPTHAPYIRTEISRRQKPEAEEPILRRTSLSQRLQEQLERRSTSLIHEYVGRSRNNAYGRQAMYTGLPLLLGDLLAIGICYACGLELAQAIQMAGSYTVTSGVYLGLILLILAAFLGSGLLDNHGLHPIFEFRQCSVATSLVFVLIAGIIVIQSGALTASLVFPLMLVSIPVNRTLMRKWLVQQSWWGVRCLVFGCDRRLARLFAGHQANAINGLKPVGFLQSEIPEDCMDELAQLHRGDVSNATIASVEQRAFCALVHRRGRSDHEILKFVDQHLGMFSRIVIVPDDHRLPSIWGLAKSGTMTLEDQLMRPSNQMAKRLLDLAVSICLLALAAPLLLLIALAIRLSTRGTVFVGEERVGRFGTRFHAWFFRTTDPAKDADFQLRLLEDPELRRQWEDTSELTCDPRQTRLGYWLVRTGLYELPNLWNVLVGQMSLVGPRPVAFDPQKEHARPYLPQDRVAPGILGFWRISDQYFEPMDRRVELDRFYVKNWSIWFDIFIVIHWLRHGKRD